MHRLWKPALEPIIEALRPSVIVEIGAARGLNTRNLLEYARSHDAVVHVIDPEPAEGFEEWQAAWGDVVQWHAAPSLEALGTIDRPDLILIDGDHNWYTVVNELRIIDNMASEHFPVTLLHDVGWPYGRRDLYYVPERIPPEHRHEHALAGMRLDVDGLDPEGGYNRSLHNATSTGGERNGVLTAAEDFVAESRRDLTLTVIPAVHGLGIIFDNTLRDIAPATLEVIETLSGTPRHTELLATVERLRLEDTVSAYNLRRDLTAAHRKIRDLSVALESTRQSIPSRDRLEKLSAELDSALADLAAALQESQRHIAIARDAADRWARLRSRRSVRLALAVARPTKPVFRWIRAVRTRLGGHPSKNPE